MIQGKTILAVIPARGGSKRLPRKNIMLLNNKPLLAYSIEAGVGSKYVDEVMVSTDDEEIAIIAQKFGASVPFLRPPGLASDEASSEIVACHALEYYQGEKGRNFDYLVLLQPTSPLRTAKHVDEAFEMLIKKKADGVISVCKSEHSPLWANVLPEDFSMDGFISSSSLQLRSQDLPQYYRLNGAIYICDVNRFLKERDFFLSSKVFAYQMEQSCSVDIDTQIDFHLCRVLMKTTERENEDDEQE